MIIESIECPECYAHIRAQIHVNERTLAVTEDSVKVSFEAEMPEAVECPICGCAVTALDVNGQLGEMSMSC